MKPIGGYFELELNSGKQYHAKALSLNLGRSAFEYLLRARKVKLVYLPYYTCDVMLQTVKKLGLHHEFYHINEKMEPVIDFGKLRKNAFFVYTNYFGLKDGYIKKLAGLCPNLIVDNAQAFFSKPREGVDTFYSARKYFGVPDGAFLYTTVHSQRKLVQDKSIDRFEHLLGRIENGAEETYLQFKNYEKSLDDQPIKIMSKITQKMLGNIDYQHVAIIRNQNYNYLNDSLGCTNLLNLKLDKTSTPFVYPYLPKKEGLREKLIKNKIFVALYWPNVLAWCKSSDFEYSCALKMAAIPVDQRISKNELDLIINIVTG